MASVDHGGPVQAARRDPRTRHRLLAAHPQLAHTLAEHGLTLDPVSGEVVELQPFNAVMSKRSAQIDRTLQRLQAEWEAAHPGEEPGPVMTARMQGIAWATSGPARSPPI